jgi:hypothetical protein
MNNALLTSLDEFAELILPASTPIVEGPKVDAALSRLSERVVHLHQVWSTYEEGGFLQPLCDDLADLAIELRDLVRSDTQPECIWSIISDVVNAVRLEPRTDESKASLAESFKASLRSRHSLCTFFAVNYKWHDTIERGEKSAQSSIEVNDHRPNCPEIQSPRLSQTTARDVKLSFDQMVKEIVALGQSMPSPDLEAVKADWRWVNQQRNLDAFRPFEGQHLAVIDQEIVDHDPSSLRLQLRIARDRGIHPERVVIFYVEPAD